MALAAVSSREDLGVGQARVVVDGDVHELPASGADRPARR
jgi:hypothetical protein